MLNFTNLHNKGVPGPIIPIILEKLTAHDGYTLRPEIQRLLETDRKPNITPTEWSRKEIEAWTDGSWHESTQKGSYAIYLGKNTNKHEGFAVPTAYSSFEVELRPIIHVLSIVPWEETVVIYTDSESSIVAIDTEYRRVNHTKKRTKRKRVLLTQLIQLTERRKKAGGNTKINFVYSHLRDESEERPSEDIKQRQLQKEKVMIQAYGEDVDRILRETKKQTNSQKQQWMKIRKVEHIDTQQKTKSLYFSVKKSMWCKGCAQPVTNFSLRQN